MWQFNASKGKNAFASLVDFLIACKKLWCLCVLAGTSDSKNPELYYSPKAGHDLYLQCVHCFCSKMSVLSIEGQIWIVLLSWLDHQYCWDNQIQNKIRMEKLVYFCQLLFRFKTFSFLNIFVFCHKRLPKSRVWGIYHILNIASVFRVRF